MEINSGGGSGGGSSSLTVTDGITPVVNVTTIDFTAGATVTNGGGGTANVVVSGTGGFTVMVPTGTVNGSNNVFVFSSAPQVIVIDNATVMNKKNITPDLTDNWTGTTNVTLTQAPNFNIYGY